MIKYIQIENFKSIKELGLPLERLNLFFGMNGMGKSSVIQSLLLLRQSYWQGDVRGLHGLVINGSLISLGSSLDILCQYADKEEIRFLVICDKDNRIDVSYNLELLAGPSNILKVNDLGSSSVPFADSEPLFGKEFIFLGANHIDPQNAYNALNWNKDGINCFGGHGEYAVPFLAQEGNLFRVPDELCLDSGKTNRLFDQVSAWMSTISPGIKIGARYLPFEQQAKLDISYADQRMDSAPFLPVNVGFGIPYVLPLIIALLTAKKDSLIIIENPESHLHPRGQVEVARLISKAANMGAQIICESHSDHIINGIRVAVKEKQLKSNDLVVSFFEKDDNQITKVTQIDVDGNGTLSDYPAGLLDEWGIQMSLLF